MNNSELSVVNSSVDSFAKSSASVFPSDWDNSRSETRQNGSSHGNGNNSGGLASIERAVGSASGLDGRDEVCSEWKSTQPDRGLWLFESLAGRHDHWKCLRETVPAVPYAHESSLRYSSSLFKRGLDVVGSLFLLAALLPLLLLTAILIKLDSPGPVFFRHDRVGKDGERFLLWKFRSMKTTVPKYELSPRSSGDPRLTRVGKLIRRMSIDELPQLFNVLKGEMSLVGPRPEMPFVVTRYRSFERRRLAAKPGITGLWQISAARALPIHENLQYDLHYICNQNAILDCAILARTIAAVLGGVGAV